MPTTLPELKKHISLTITKELLLYQQFTCYANREFCTTVCTFKPLYLSTITRKNVQHFQTNKDIINVARNLASSSTNVAARPSVDLIATEKRAGDAASNQSDSGDDLMTRTSSPHDVHLDDPDR